MLDYLHYITSMWYVMHCMQYTYLYCLAILLDWTVRWGRSKWNERWNVGRQHINHLSLLQENWQQLHWRRPYASFNKTLQFEHFTLNSWQNIRVWPNTINVMHLWWWWWNIIIWDLSCVWTHCHDNLLCNVVSICDCKQLLHSLLFASFYSYRIHSSFHFQVKLLDASCFSWSDHLWTLDKAGEQSHFTNQQGHCCLQCSMSCICYSQWFQTCNHVQRCQWSKQWHLQVSAYCSYGKKHFDIQWESSV